MQVPTPKRFVPYADDVIVLMQTVLIICIVLVVAAIVPAPYVIKGIIVLHILALLSTHVYLLFHIRSFGHSDILVPTKQVFFASYFTTQVCEGHHLYYYFAFNIHFTPFYHIQTQCCLIKLMCKLVIRKLIKFRSKIWIFNYQAFDVQVTAH